jgi:GNAT superfamily N-acetyltransferase
MAAYFAELDVRFRGGFDPGAGGAGKDAESMSAPDGAFVLARSDSAVVGCGGVLRIDARTGEIKRMWIHHELRGAGLGRRLLAELEATAARLGRTRVVLDTNEVLAEAVAMYERSGYRSIERYNDNPYAHHWFEKSLTRRARDAG